MKNLYFTADIILDNGPLKRINNDAGGIIIGHLASAGCVAMAVICDGLECVPNGLAASRYISEQFFQWFENELMAYAEGRSFANIKKYVNRELQQIFNRCNLYLFEKKKEHMHSGTMAEVLFVTPGWYCSCGIGSCGVFCVNRYKHYFRYGCADEKSYGNAHIIKDFLGQSNVCNIHCHESDVRSGDVFFVHNSGFSRRVSEWYIYNLFRMRGGFMHRRRMPIDIHSILVHLINVMRQRGEGDNIIAAYVCCIEGGRNR